MYVFASSACEARYATSGVMPKCNYRSEDLDEQNAMCNRLIAFSDYNSNPLCGAGDAVIEAVKTSHYLWRTLQEYYVGLLVETWNCLNVKEGPDMDFAMCAAKLAETSIPPAMIFDLIECQSAEMSYRIITFGISLLTPMFQVIYDAVDYPANGYYGGGLLDGIQHVQAKPLECAFATTLMAFNAPQWIVHILADVGKQLIMLIEDVKGAVSGDHMSDVIDEFTDAIFDFNTEAVITVFRTIVISFRDFLIGILELARAISTMVHFQQSDPENRDPRTPSDKRARVNF
jgi:hypothetical protein